ncbi:MAG: GDSL-type esterase/lipase family protein [Bifidobacteriaceae bacterium]|jgi:hypothetical protein|nr:GDSL-type esterase/lipase family protein [Bifidobacteriaceae bacterium]
MSRFRAAWATRPWAMDQSTAGFLVRDHSQVIALRNNLAGERLRVQFCNLLGREPVSLTGVTASCGGVAAPVTLGGDETIVLPPGAEPMSDDIGLAAVPGEPIRLTTHVAGEQEIRGFAMLFLPEFATVEKRGFSASPFPALGDAEAVDKLVNFYGVSALEVDAADDARVVAMFGDSITHMSTVSGPLARRLYETFPGRVGFKSAGITGNRLLRGPQGGLPMSEWYGPAGVSRFDQDVFGGAKVDLVVILEGVNDLCHPAMAGKPDELPTPDALAAGLAGCAATAHRLGAQALACTLPPFGAYPCWNPELERIRQDFNDWIRDNRAFDGFLDFDASLADQDAPHKIADQWHTGDGLHPNLAAGEHLARGAAFETLRDFVA